MSMHKKLFHYLHYKSTNEVKITIFVLLVFMGSLVPKPLSIEISSVTAAKLILYRSSHPLLLSSSLMWLLNFICVQKGFQLEPLGLRQYVSDTLGCT